MRVAARAMPEALKPDPEEVEPKAEPEPPPARPDDAEVGDFITRNVLEKDSVFFEG
jgi:hypothetical protein